MARQTTNSRGELLPSADVVSYILHFICAPPQIPSDSSEATAAPKYAVKLRGTSELWSRAFGQFLELWVIPRGTQLDDGGRATWSPSGNAELLLVLLHLDDGLTRRLTTSFLFGLSLQSLPRPVVQRMLLPDASTLAAVQRLKLFGPGPSSEELTTALMWFPNLTSLSLNAEKLGLSEVLLLPSTMEELSLAEAPELATDSVLQELSRHFCRLRVLGVPWGPQMTTAAAQFIGAMPALRSLALRATTSELGLTVLDGVTGMRHLVELTLSSSHLTELPESIGELIALQRLDLEHNLLTSLPESFGALTALETLDLEDNELVSLPDPVCGLTSLQRLYLSANRLTVTEQSG